MTQEEFSKKLQEMEIPQEVCLDEKLSEEAHSLFRGCIGRCNWVCYKTRPDTCFDTWSMSTKVQNPTWQDVVDVNKLVRKIKHHASTSLVLNRMRKPVRVVAYTDASFNRHRTEPSIYAGIFMLSDFDVDYDQDLYTSDPKLDGQKTKELLCNASPCYWRLRVVKRRVDNIMECETLAISWSTCVARYLTGLVTELGLNEKQYLKPVILNDNNSTISHLRSGNKANNPRLTVLWSTLCDSFNRGEFGLRHICGKTSNISDVLTKQKSPILTLLLKCLRLGKSYIPSR